MKSYELTVVLRNKESEPLRTKVNEILVKHGAANIQEAHWGTRRLAYRISKEAEAFYYFATLDLPEESIKKIISEFRLMSDILRFLFVKMEAKKEKESA